MTIYALADKKPQLPPEGEYWVAPNAMVIGNVILQPGASIWAMRAGTWIVGGAD